MRDTPSSVGLPELPKTRVRLKKQVEKSAEYRAFLREKVFFNPVIWVIGFAKFCLYVTRFWMLDWGPAMFQQSKGVSLLKAGGLVAVFEIVGVIGMISMGWATDRFLKGYAHRTAALCMAGTAISIFVIWQIPAGSPAWMLIIALCFTGFFLNAVQALITISVSNQATKKVAPTAAGFTGIFAYASTLLSGLGFGYLAQHYGWCSVYLLVVIIALVGTGLFLSIWRIKPHGYETDPEQPPSAEIPNSNNQ